MAKKHNISKKQVSNIIETIKKIIAGINQQKEYWTAKKKKYEDKSKPKT